MVSYTTHVLKCFCFVDSFCLSFLSFPFARHICLLQDFTITYTMMHLGRHNDLTDKWLISSTKFNVNDYHQLNFKIKGQKHIASLEQNKHQGKQFHDGLGAYGFCLGFKFSMAQLVLVSRARAIWLSIFSIRCNVTIIRRLCIILLHVSLRNVSWLECLASPPLEWYDHCWFNRKLFVRLQWYVNRLRTVSSGVALKRITLNEIYHKKLI